jgi:hypothetical protein
MNKTSLTIVAEDGFTNNLDNTRNRMHNPAIKIWWKCLKGSGESEGMQ